MRSKDSYRSAKRRKMKGSFVPSVEARQGATIAGEPRGKSFYPHPAMAPFFFPDHHKKSEPKKE